jgi:hypothetical protein
MVYVPIAPPFIPRLKSRGLSAQEWGDTIFGEE